MLTVDLGGMEQQFFVSHSLKLLISSRFLPESTQLTRLTESQQDEMEVGRARSPSAGGIASSFGTRPSFTPWAGESGTAGASDQGRGEYLPLVSVCFEWITDLLRV